MYMIQGKPYRKKLHDGDVFIINYPEGKAVPVLVARAKSNPEDPVLANYLIYIYEMVNRPLISGLDLDRSNFMLPPMVVNRLGWSWGYFEKYDFDRDLAMSHVAREHCLANCYYSPTGCVNEWGHVVECVSGAIKYQVGNANFLDVIIAGKMGWDKELAGRHP